MISAGERIYVPGSSGEPTALVGQIFGAVDARIVTSFTPGANVLTPEMFGPGTTVSSPFMSARLSDMQRAGRYRHLPLSYFAMAKYLREAAPFDACVVQLSPPDDAGFCSLGTHVEFTADVMKRARRVIAVINPHVPRMRRCPGIQLAACHTVVESDLPLVSSQPEPADEITRRIAAHSAAFIKDGATLQIGLGRVPNALIHHLTSRRNLRIHSGLLSDGLMTLAEAGALDEGHTHTGGVLLGTPAFYAWAGASDLIEMRSVNYTHDPAVMARLERFVSINAALEVDLFGQANLELANGRAVSGGGGASDFAHGARLAAGGISIIALPATFGAGQSRIKAKLDDTGITTLPRTDVDLVITEEGVADLRGRSVHERAERLIAVAAPTNRAALADKWREIAARL